MVGRRLSADFGPLRDRNHMIQQRSDIRQEDVVRLDGEKKSLSETMMMCEGQHERRTLTSSGEHLLSCCHLHTKHSSAGVRPQLQAAALGAAECFDTCCHFTDDFGKLVELDVVITLKLQQHHLQVHVVAHLKLPHSPSRLLVQGCCRGNVAEDTEMGNNKGRQPEETNRFSCGTSKRSR